MISGTYVFTDTINSTFDKVFEDANEGVDVVVSGRSEFDTDNGAVSQEIPESLVERVKKVPGVLVAAGSVEDYASIFKANGRSDQDRRRPAAAVLAPAGALRPAQLCRGRAALEPQRGLDRQGHRGQGEPQGRRQGLAGRQRSGKAELHDLRPRQVRRCRVARRRHRVRRHAAGGAAHRRPARPGRLDPGRRRARCQPQRSWSTRIERVLPSTVEVKTGAAGRRRPVRVDPEQPQLPQHAAARVRRHRAVRGRVHHLQHVLDHGRAAHEGVRAAAHDGCLARPGPALGAAGGADRRPDRVDPRHCCSASSPRKGITALFKAFGADLPQEGLVLKRHGRSSSACWSARS